MIKNKHFVVTADVYRRDVLFVIGVPDSSFKKTVEGYTTRGHKIDIGDHDDGYYSVTDGNTSGLMLPFTSGASIIRLQAYDDNSVEHRAIVSHEIMHSVSHMLRTLGLPLTKESEEAYTYLYEFIMTGFNLGVGVGK